MTILSKAAISRAFPQFFTSSVTIFFKVSSTNSSAINIIQKDEYATRGHPGHWCSVITQFPSYFYQPSSTHPPYLKTIVQHSRPWFASLAVEFYDENPTGSLKEMLFSIYRKVMASKRQGTHSDDQIFLQGELGLFLSTSYTKISALINRYFADLDEPENFDLTFASGTLYKYQKKSEKRGQAWILSYKVKFPPVREDLLLYLALIGGKNQPVLITSTNERRSFMKCIREVEGAQELNFNVKNSNQDSNDDMKLEAAVAGVLLLTSHENRLQGSTIQDVLCRLIYEIDIAKEAPSRLSGVPPKLNLFMNILIPFLSPPNMEFDDFLKKDLADYATFGELERIRNADRIDGTIEAFEVDSKEFSDLKTKTFEDIRSRFGPKSTLKKIVTLELKNWGKALDIVAIESIVMRAPVTSRVHLVFSNRIQGNIYTRKKEKTWMKFVEQNPNISETWVRRLDGVNIKSINGIDDLCDEPKQLILFIPIFGDQTRDGATKKKRKIDS